MAINIREKGAGGERQIADDLNFVINCVLKELGLPYMTKPIVQRNQNQTAVGGQDLVGTLGYAIEVKRQEALSINTWWTQCVASAKHLNEVPVLIFRQNNAKWRVIMPVAVPMAHGTSLFNVRGEIPYDDFKTIFRMAAMSHFATRTGDLYANA